MARIIFVIWYLTCGYVFWKVTTNNFDEDTREDIRKILELHGKGLEYAIWYTSAIMVIIFWPILATKKLINRCKHIFRGMGEKE